MAGHKFTFSMSPERSARWRIWNEYPNPMRDALLAVSGIAVIVTCFGSCKAQCRCNSLGVS